MSLVSDAGSRFSSGLWASSVCPLVRSTRTNDVAAIGGGGKAPVGAAIARSDCLCCGRWWQRRGRERRHKRRDDHGASGMVHGKASSGKAVDYRLRGSTTISHRPGRQVIRSRDIGIAALGVMLVASGCATRHALDRDHAALVAAERAFARHAEDADVRTAFLAAFADDGIWMTPEPMRLRDAYAARPAPADPRAVRLEWDPAISGIAASGDFGFTSGPSSGLFSRGF